MSRYTMDAIASCAFGVNANAMEDPNCKFITTMKSVFEPTGFQMLLGSFLIFILWIQHYVSPKRLGNVVNDFVRKTFWEVVDYRKTNGVVRKDVVDLLMQLHEHGVVRAEDAKDLEEIKQDSKFVNLENSTTDDSDINKFK
ncbi:hypothetical protein PR048_019384 [Dryococelus australis]|uniref:Uncharacterized protein n=1 Tax=Dryococelus australis TaxID=614101 RepID=A0ABQ9H3P6_9NEOP|nr:hypothetical protein PR048_019384 [Dryococelus australis]